jgi:putative IMPACT (imprinted ancient) family translation regulator
MSKYKTLQALSTGEFKDRGSRFIGYAQPADNEDESKKMYR